jgi:hypothetical protein
MAKVVIAAAKTISRQVALNGHPSVQKRRRNRTQGSVIAQALIGASAVSVKHALAPIVQLTWLR